MEEVKEVINEWPVTSNTSTQIHISSNKRQIDDFPVNSESVETKKRQDGDRIKNDVKNPAKITKSFDIVSADVALARWWRREGRRFIPPAKLPKSTNPNTILNFVQRTDIAKKFLRTELKKLENLASEQTKLSNSEENGRLYTATASFHDKLGDLEKAKDAIDQALIFSPNDSDALWLRAKIERQLKIQSIQLHHQTTLDKFGKTKVFPAFKSVERRSFKDLSCREFYDQYSKTSTPVIITDYLPCLASTQWTFNHIKEKAGKCSVTLKHCVSDSVEWARLEDDSTTTTVAEFIDKLQNEMAEGMYLFDWSLPLNCPKLTQELTIPRYFAGDFLQRTSPGSLYQDSWPSLFIAPKGLTTQLHVDAFGSNFWMALFQGRKRWVFFPKEDQPLLYPQYLHSMDPVFEAEIERPNLITQPLLGLTQPLECILQPGELLFVPAGCPHRVENLDMSLAISGNFVDLSNFQLVKDELKINALNDPRANELLHQFKSESFKSDMDFDIGDLSWNEFKINVRQDLESNS